MVTTRSRDLKRASLPSPAANIRKRFNSEESENSIVVEIPPRSLVDPDKEGQSDEINTQSANDIDENDEAPEVISSKDAAQQARGLPNRSLPPRGNKRRKIALDLSNGESPSTELPGASGSRIENLNSEVSESTGKDLKGSDLVALQTQPSTAENVLIPREDSTALESTIQADKLSSAETNQTSIKRASSSEDLVANKAEETETGALLHNGASDVVDSGPSSPEKAVEPHQQTTSEVRLLADESNQQETSKEGAHSAGKPELDQLAKSTLIVPTSPSEQAISKPQPQEIIEESASQSLKATPPPLVAAEGKETTETKAQLLATTANLDVQMFETPKSPTSSVITPVWQTRTPTHDSTPVLARNVTAFTSTTASNPLHPHARTSLSLRHRPALFSKSKPKPSSSIQQYRNRLLNRHARTANWGPAGFQSSKFVGA